MYYRAKITKIQSWIENHYSTTAYSIVRDANDVYIEVKNEDEAELIEEINRYETKLLDLKKQLLIEYIL